MKRLLLGLFLFSLFVSTANAIPRAHLHPQTRVAYGLRAQITGNACATNAGAVGWTGTPHGVCVSWNASTSTVVGYNVYRGTISGGPYTKLTSTITANTFFLDTTAVVNTLYFYVGTAVDSNGNESAYSNQASLTTPATFPANPVPQTGMTVSTH